ncbi:MAG: hypothetical protein U1D30_06160 [Planctomycetota bacterium]
MPGEDPNEAYIKVVHHGNWEVKASAPLAVEQGRDYRISFSRKGNQLEVKVDGRSWLGKMGILTGRVGSAHNTKLDPGIPSLP